MKLLILFLFIHVQLYSATLPVINVFATKPIPYKGIYQGKNLLNNFDNTLKTNTLLLAAYIHTQSIGEKTNRHLGDKYAIAQVIVTRLKYRYGKCKYLDEYLLKYSRTIRTNISNYFWIDSNEYYSQQCLLAAYNVLTGNIPKEFDVGLATRFFTDRDPIQPSKHHEFVKEFNHSFFISKNFIKNNYEVHHSNINPNIIFM